MLRIEFLLEAEQEITYSEVPKKDFRVFLERNTTYIVLLLCTN